MQSYNEFLKKCRLKPISYFKKGKSLIIETKDKKYVLKEKINDPSIYEYLSVRSFNNYPVILFKNDYYDITDYIEEEKIPEDQKLEELMKIVATLHSKTTYYEVKDLAYFKEIYETLNNNIEYLNSYYFDIITLIDTKEFMSPSEYLFARNYTMISSSLNLAHDMLNNWYKKVENLTSTRMVVLHNNLNLEHFIYNKSKTLISWRKSKFGCPIFDLLAIFNEYGNKYNFLDKLKMYELIYPLKDEEKELLFIFMIIPPKIEFKESEYDLCLYLTKKVELLYKANKIVLPYKFKNSKENNEDKDKNHKNTEFS